MILTAGCGGGGAGDEPEVGPATGTGAAGDPVAAPATPAGPVPADRPDAAAPAPATGLVFRDEAAARGLDAVHRSGDTGTFAYPEIVTGGACLADFDGDGDLDVFLPQGGPLPGSPGRGASADSARDRLYLNDGAGRFRAASDGSGADHPGYTNGAFAADVDADGDLDLLLTGTGSLALLAGRGDGTFEDITGRSGPGPFAGDDGIWLNAAFGDLDGDGILDVYLSRYTTWTFGSDPTCSGTGGLPDYCNPNQYPGATDRLLRGRGDGTFEDVTAAAGIDAAATRSMGVVILDPDGDGDLDLYVANDGEANLLWINDGTGRFRDEAIIRGVALDGAGRPEAGMGIAVADVDRDGDEDLLVTHLARETHTLYRNDGGVFTDASAAAGLTWSAPDTGFGAVLADFDHDGRPDLYVAGGGVLRAARPVDPADPYALFDRAVRQGAGGRFTAVPDLTRAGSGVTGPADVARGVAAGDVDGDGDVDLLVAVKDGPVRLMINDGPKGGGWIAVRPVDSGGTVAAIGATVRRIRAGGASAPTAIAMLRPHGSYLGSSDPVVHFGLGTARGPVDLEVTWPDGRRERFDRLAANRRRDLVRGSGRAPGASAGADAAAAAGTGAAGSESAAADDAAPDPPRPDLTRLAAAGPPPPLTIDRTNPRRLEVRTDHAALAAWTANAGLPPLAALGAYDPPTWGVLHAALTAAAADPSAATLGELAMVLHGHGPPDAAAAMYEVALGLDPADGRWWHLLGRLRLAEGDAVNALPALRRAAAAPPTEPSTHAAIGEALSALGRPTEAASAWRRAADGRADDPAGWIGLANALDAIDDVDGAAAAIAEALRRAPSSRPVLVAAARLATRRGDSAAAAAHQAALATAAPGDTLPSQDAIDRSMRARALTRGYLRAASTFLRQQGRIEPAYNALRMLAEREPDAANTWKVLTRLALDRGQPQQASDHALVAVDLDPNFAPGWELVARSRADAGDPNGALEAARRATAADPNFVAGWVTTGAIHVRRGESAAALFPLDEAIRRNPGNAQAHALRSVCLLQLGRRDEAAASAGRALALDPSNAIARQVQAALSGPGG